MERQNRRICDEVRALRVPAVALMVDNTEMGLETLASKGFSIISEADLDEEE